MSNKEGVEIEFIMRDIANGAYGDMGVQLAREFGLNKAEVIALVGQAMMIREQRIIIKALGEDKLPG